MDGPRRTIYPRRRLPTARLSACSPWRPATAGEAVLRSPEWPSATRRAVFASQPRRHRPALMRMTRWSPRGRRQVSHGTSIRERRLSRRRYLPRARGIVRPGCRSWKLRGIHNSPSRPAATATRSERREEPRGAPTSLFRHARRSDDPPHCPSGRRGATSQCEDVDARLRRRTPERFWGLFVLARKHERMWVSGRRRDARS